MPDCSYCTESFEDEDAYLNHLEAVHEDELGPIDQRRVGGEEESGFGARSVILGIVTILPIAVLVYVVFIAGSAPESSLAKPETEPTGIGTVHEHGTINVTIDGTELDFGRDRFQRAAQYDAFHFEGGDGEIWHVHARRVTLKYAMWTLGIGVSNDTVRYDGTTYRDGVNATVIIEVNGEPVDPSEYVLSGASVANADEGDHIRIVVRTN